MFVERETGASVTAEIEEEKRENPIIAHTPEYNL
jgi:hypothetical protein